MEKEKIRFTQTLSTDREVFRRGKEYDVDPVTAEEMVRHGVAVAAEVAPPPGQPASNPAPSDAIDEQKSLEILPHADLLALASQEDVKGVTKKQTPAQIAAAIVKHRAEKAAATPAA